jgi:hypothetical protein
VVEGQGSQVVSDETYRGDPRITSVTDMLSLDDLAFMAWIGVSQSRDTKHAAPIIGREHGPNPYPEDTVLYAHEELRRASRDLGRALARYLPAWLRSR